METGYIARRASVEAGLAGTAARERDPNCIEMHLKNIEVELAESLNSAENLADKIRGCEKAAATSTPPAPAPSDIDGRLQLILNNVRALNQQLGRAHSAISG